MVTYTAGKGWIQMTNRHTLLTTEVQVVGLVIEPHDPDHDEKQERFDAMYRELDLGIEAILTNLSEKFPEFEFTNPD